ncbi:MAG: threonine-phosphate decarboxylase CobD [Rhodospirillales bacterium]|jgi:cobalamin biosynthetic protein CobC|nr:threonine-phosphate decarboxylase CobD [Rhodospirillales bacterium]
MVQSSAVSGPIEHGGAIDAAVARYGIPRGRWLDLSTGINPNPYPLPDVPAETWTRLPDEAIDASLRQAAASRYGVADPACVVAAPGSQALIQWLPRLRAPSRVAVLGPTYGEHAACWSAAGHRVTEIAASEPPEGDVDVDVVVAVNPNNPDGRVIGPARLLALLDRLDRDGGLLVVDEAFADAVPDVSVAPRAGRRGLVVLRSFGKFHGLAGLRLGFALASRDMAGHLGRALGPWAVGGPAAAIGAAALADASWAGETRARLAADAGRLDDLLRGSGLTVTGGTPLFRLAVDEAAQDLFEHLARAGILVRRFSGEATWLRFGIPGGAAEFERLGATLAEWTVGAAGQRRVGLQTPCA